MSQIAYIEKSFARKSLEIIDQANQICADYQRQGYDLTLRQLYYQFVSRDLIPNKDTEYKRLGDIINDARLAGLLDWDYIVDRTRNLRGLTHWATPAQRPRLRRLRLPHHRWANQPHHVEVWIEKDALVGVIARRLRPSGRAVLLLPRLHQPVRTVGRRAAARYATRTPGRRPVIIHLGDHDPSGIDMTRDINDRLALFGADAQVQPHRAEHGPGRQYQPAAEPGQAHRRPRGRLHRTVHGA